MTAINLKRLVKRKDVAALVSELVAVLDRPIAIQNLDGTLLWGDSIDALSEKHPIELNGEVLGWVFGNPGTAIIASLLIHLAIRELEQKMLARETLDKYKEITLLYDISEKITANLDLQAVANLVLEEAQRLIRGTSGSVVFFNQDRQEFEILAAFGAEYQHKLSIVPGKGIIGMVLQSGIGEIVNDVSTDHRVIPGEYQFASLICAPLKTKDRVMGVLNLSSVEPVNYTAADLKLFNALASQAASAIENAMLHANKLKEERIKSNLERYVPSQVVEAILQAKDDISLEPVKSDIVMLFSDIRSFTTKCEELAPEQIVGYLNEYFTHMVEVIFDYEGTVNKFVGDMIVALFGAPTHLRECEEKAIRAAIAMQKRIQEVPTTWIRENFRTGIGISSGPVVVGNIGSPQHMDYTAIGDEMNIASRLQSIAEGGQILVSRSVYDATRHLFSFKECGDLTVKGKRKTVEVFEVLY
ncbi:guanylate cyclase [Leptolyngbya sp. 'hensonii']|uniref:adenylate/guanylate cyclase domain-containing protein n=1 Tax=Leptolyngbya sp. 'hensonii' TaxID=1922337 RepID=UPI00094F6C67|nr:adenylate/guanylate cyclase domain-containing protein [Leptolyngbya sp. 'hensonii']OLP18155.1 guanylate cyclase [Leptolyngbya sp. 'hensonii']